MHKQTLEQIHVLSRSLRLPAFRDNLEKIFQNAIKEKMPYEQVLLILLQAEEELRIINRKKVQMRNAGFPQLKYLQDISRPDLPADGQEKLPELETLAFITQGRNVILGGSPGTGKTHMAIGLGIKACQEGKSVFYTTVSRLLTQIRESYSTKSLRSLEIKFEKYDLVICDEFGYLSFDKQGAEMLFNHLSLRTGFKSTIITSNTPFDKWQAFFGKQAVLTAALLDRLTHKAYLVNMNGKSYRMKETKNMLKDSIMPPAKKQ
jgi:DNA replication protein DnaC